MPTWTSSTVGGSWLGGGTTVTDCTSSQQTAITNAFDSFIENECLDCFPGLREQLESTWRTVEIDCTDPACSGLDGRWTGKILLCCVNIGCTGSSVRLAPVLLHELVHAVGGTELDAEAVEHACFDGNGATLPTSADFDLFRSDGGNFAEWDSDTGEVWGVSNGDRGRQCFQDDGWKHTFPGGGGWI